MDKKQLIIIPPMSESLKKLNEVLEGIANEENVEINIIDDLRELNQFLTATGQCLILFSNAKKCITFLQENRFIIAKHHCKTILCTPAEIPPKTLSKLTKIGLTENILENSSPKTFVYKVKLLLRSIKTSSRGEEGKEAAEKVVKSMLETSPAEGKNIVEKLTTTNLTLDFESSDKKSSTDNKVSTLAILVEEEAKKAKHQDHIETHWTSGVKKPEINLFGTPEENKIVQEKPDTPLVSKSNEKKPLSTLEEAALDYRKRKQQEEIEIEKEKKEEKKSALPEDNSGMLNQKISLVDAEKEEDVKPKETKTPNEIDLVSEKKKKEPNSFLNEEKSAESGEEKGLSYLEDAVKEKKKREMLENDLGDYYNVKNKNRNTNILENPLDQLNKERENRYDNSETNTAEKKASGLKLQEGQEREGKNSAGNLLPEEVDGKSVAKGKAQEDESASRVKNLDQKIALEEESDETSKKLKLQKGKRADDDEEEEEKNEKKRSNRSSSLNTPLEKAPEKEREGLLPQRKEEDLNHKKSLDREALESAEKKKKEKGLEELLDESKRKKEVDPAIEAAAKNRKQDDEKQAREKNLSLKNIDEVKLDLEKSKKSSEEGPELEKARRRHGHDDLGEEKQNWDGLFNQKNSSPSWATQGAQEENAIDYRRLKKEFETYSTRRESKEEEDFARSKGSLGASDDEMEAKVIEINPCGLDFSINIINAIYNKDVKAKQILALLAQEIVQNYGGSPIFYTYKLYEKKFVETYISFNELTADKMPAARKSWWSDFNKQSPEALEHYKAQSMTTWQCLDIIKNDRPWEDTELPVWAEQELKDKQVQLIFPYFDGIDRMGLAVVFFHEGLDVRKANGVLTLLELARAIFLDTIQRQNATEESPKLPLGEQTKKVFGFFASLFGKNKAS